MSETSGFLEAEPLLHGWRGGGLRKAPGHSQPTRRQWGTVTLPTVGKAKRAPSSWAALPGDLPGEPGAYLSRDQRPRAPNFSEATLLSESKEVESHRLFLPSPSLISQTQVLFWARRLQPLANAARAAPPSVLGVRSVPGTDLKKKRRWLGQSLTDTEH